MSTRLGVFVMAAVLALYIALVAHRGWLLLTSGQPVGIAMGAVLFFLLSGLVTQEAFAPRALGFSAGTFLHLAVADLIPDLHRRREDRLSLSAALLAGIVLMAAVGQLHHDH